MPVFEEIVGLQMLLEMLLLVVVTWHSHRRQRREVVIVGWRHLNSSAVNFENNEESYDPWNAAPSSLLSFNLHDDS